MRNREKIERYKRQRQVALQNAQESEERCEVWEDTCEGLQKKLVETEKKLVETEKKLVETEKKLVETQQQVRFFLGQALVAIEATPPAMDRVHGMIRHIMKMIPEPNELASTEAEVEQ